VASSFGERKRKEREEKLERMREQLASGRLVIRQMTADESAGWTKRRLEFEATATPAERDRRDNAIKKRLKRNARQSL
jgi:hypothetical protein